MALCSIALHMVIVRRTLKRAAAHRNKSLTFNGKERVCGASYSQWQ
jgi:hypothetical protein